VSLFSVSHFRGALQGMLLFPARSLWGGNRLSQGKGAGPVVRTLVRVLLALVVPLGPLTPVVVAGRAASQRGGSRQKIVEPAKKEVRQRRRRSRIRCPPAHPRNCANCGSLVDGARTLQEDGSIGWHSEVNKPDEEDAATPE